MTDIAQRIWQEDDGVLSFEWVLLFTLVALGLVSGLAAARDGFIDELNDIAEALVCIDQSYTVAATDVFPAIGYDDEKPPIVDCGRTTAP